MKGPIQRLSQVIRPISSAQSELDYTSAMRHVCMQQRNLKGVLNQSRDTLFTRRQRARHDTAALVRVLNRA